MSTAPKIPRPKPPRKARALPVAGTRRRQHPGPAPPALIPQKPHGIKATLEIDARALDATIFLDEFEFELTWEPSRGTEADEQLDAVLRDVPAAARAPFLLLRAARAAAHDGNASLARILFALHLSSDAGDLAWLTKGKASPLAHAETFLKDRFHVDSWQRAAFATRRERTALLHALSRYFERQPVEVERLVPLVAYELRVRRAELLLGAPRCSRAALREALLEQLTKVSRRTSPSLRTARHFVHAVLRAWGLSDRQAVDATKRMD